MRHVFFSPGGYGRLRASHRKLAAGATEHNPVHTHREADKRLLKGGGDVVPLEIDLRPYGIVFEKGEGLRLTIAGADPHHNIPWVEPPASITKGRAVVWMGGQRDSKMVLPEV